MPVNPIHLTNINLSIKVDTCPSKCKIAKVKPSFIKKQVKTEAKKSVDLFLYCF